MRLLAIVALLLAGSCTPEAPDVPPQPTQAPDVERGRGATVRIVSVVGHPNGSGPAWQLPADQDAIELRITLEGRGRFELKAELASLDGDFRRDFARSVELDGEQTVDLGDALLPVPGSYRLTIEVAGEGVRSRQMISVRRG